MSQPSLERRGCMACLNAFVGAAALLLVWGVYRNALPLAPPIVISPPPKVNGYDDFVRAGTLAAAVPSLREAVAITRRAAVLPPELAARVASASGPVLDAVRAGLRKKCACPRRQAWREILTEPTWPTESLATDMVAAAVVRDNTGHAGDSANILLDEIEVGVRCTRGGGIRDYVAGDAMQRVGIAALERVLPLLAPGDLARVAARLDTIAGERPPAKSVLYVEKGIVAAAQVHLSRAGLGPALWIGRCIPSLDPADDIRRQWKMLSTIAAECRGPYSRASRVDIHVWRTSYTTARSVLIFKGCYFTMTASLALLRTEVALYRYRAAHQRFPGTLADLTPGLLDAVPADPFGGRADVPFRYRITGRGGQFLMYSLGPDMHDDNGALPRSISMMQSDLVAGHLFQLAGRRR